MRDRLVNRLTKEYSKKTVSRPLMDDMRRYIYRVDGISHEPIDYVKMFVKKTWHLADQDPLFLADEVDGNLTLGRLARVYEFGLEAVGLIQSGKKRGRSKKHANSLESHLYGNIASIARVIYSQTGDTYWGEEWLDCWSTAAELTIKVEPDFACMADERTLGAAQTLFEDTADPSFKFDSYRHLKRLTELELKEGDLITASRRCFTASMVMFEIFDIFGDLSYAERGYADRRRAGDMRKKYSSVEAARTYEELSRFAGQVYEMTGDPVWRERNKGDMKLAAKTVAKTDPGESAGYWTKLGHMIRSNENFVGLDENNIGIIKEQADCFRRAAGLYVTVEDYYQASQLLRMSANIERVLYKKTGQYGYVRNARKHLQTILELSDDHPIVGTAVFISKIKQSLDDLYAVRRKTSSQALRIDEKRKRRRKNYKGKNKKKF